MKGGTFVARVCRQSPAGGYQLVPMGWSHLGRQASCFSSLGYITIFASSIFSLASLARSLTTTPIYKSFGKITLELEKSSRFLKINNFS
nr:hypothetical protein [Candidatus Sigynarchaeota archaeon]